MNTEHPPKFPVVSSATPKPRSNRLRRYLLLSVPAGVFFVGCGAAPESFEGDAGEPVATETNALITADDLGELPDDQVALDESEPTLERKPKDDGEYERCNLSCSQEFDDYAEQLACNDYCFCVYRTTSHWISCWAALADRIRQ